MFAHIRQEKTIERCVEGTSRISTTESTNNDRTLSRKDTRKASVAERRRYSHHPDYCHPSLYDGKRYCLFRLRTNLTHLRSQSSRKTCGVCGSYPQSVPLPLQSAAYRPWPV